MSQPLGQVVKSLVYRVKDAPVLIVPRSTSAEVSVPAGASHVVIRTDNGAVLGGANTLVKINHTLSEGSRLRVTISGMNAGAAVSITSALEATATAGSIVFKASATPTVFSNGETLLFRIGDRGQLLLDFWEDV